MGNKTQYEIGKAIASGADTSKAKNTLYSAYFNTFHDQLLSIKTGLSPSFYADYRVRNGRNYPSQPLYLKYTPGRSPNLPPEYIWTSDIASEMASEITDSLFAAMKNNYQVTIDYFQDIFCEV